MPALNFQSQFAPLVESGKKRQTIRAYRKDGRDPTPGCKLYLFTGMRTKSCRRLVAPYRSNLIRVFVPFVTLGAVVKCKSAKPIHISRNEYGDPVLWRRGENGPEYLPLNTARRDGFRNEFEMADWFEKTHGLPFEGLLIRW